MNTSTKPLTDAFIFDEMLLAWNHTPTSVYGYFI